jgi:hypothetical protein
MSVLISTSAIHSQNAPSHQPIKRKYTVLLKKLRPDLYGSSATTSGIRPGDVGISTTCVLTICVLCWCACAGRRTRARPQAAQ